MHVLAFSAYCTEHCTEYRRFFCLHLHQIFLLRYPRDQSPILRLFLSRALGTRSRTPKFYASCILIPVSVFRYPCKSIEQSGITTIRLHITLLTSFLLRCDDPSGVVGMVTLVSKIHYSNYRSSAVSRSYVLIRWKTSSIAEYNSVKRVVLDA